MGKLKNSLKPCFNKDSNLPGTETACSNGGSITMANTIIWQCTWLQKWGGSA